MKEWKSTEREFPKRSEMIELHKEVIDGTKIKKVGHHRETGMTRVANLTGMDKNTLPLRF